jgi:hypothetical protein
MAAHDQPAFLAVDLAHDGVGDDHAVEARYPPVSAASQSPWLIEREIGRRIYIVNID